MSEALDPQSIRAMLGAEVRAELHALTAATETISTQADALAAPMPAHGCDVFIADSQTAGHGRHGRAWCSPGGANIYLSIGRRFSADAATLSGLSLVAGIATAESLNTICRGGFSREAAYPPPITVKWPNDLIADQRKLGGILVNLQRGEAGMHAVIGLGINVCMPTDAGAAIDQPWTDLRMVLGRSPSRRALIAALLDALLPALAEFERSGLAPFLSRWRGLDALAGRPVRVLDGPRVHEGVSAGITDSGALRVLSGDVERVFHGGEVSLRPA